MLRLSALIVATAMVASPALAQQTIRPGQTVEGELTTSDPTLDDGSHYDCFSLQTRSGRTVQIDQTSSAFDSYLTVGTGSCALPTNPESDDDGGGGLNSRLVRAGDGGILLIRVNSLEGGETGAYRLTVAETGGGAPTPPASARSSDFPTPVVSRRNNSLPLVSNTTLPEAPVCQAVYMARDELSRDSMGPRGYGNIDEIDYGARASAMRSRVRGGDPRAATVRDQSTIYRRNALAGVLGIMVDGEALGYSLAEVLALLGDCDREYGFTPATTY